MSLSFDLPAGWLEVEFGELFADPRDDVVDGPFGSNLKASEYVDAGIPIARLQNVARNLFVAKNLQYVTPEKAHELRRHSFASGDILITKLGDPLGKACLVPHSMPAGVLVADVVRARVTHPWIDTRFLCYQINSDGFIEQFKDETKGTTRPRVNLAKIRSLTARVCPLPEQRRIIAKLEELLSDLDAGVAELKAAQAKLQHYRQSLLKAAVEGSLTRAWREAHPAPEETGADLLARILRERRARWEAQQLAKFEAQGKAPTKGWQGKYSEPAAPDVAELPDLPAGWVWCSIDQLANVGTGVTPLRSNSAYFDGGAVPWVTSGALNAEVVTQATEMVTEQALRECRLEVYPVGSLLVAMYGEGKTRGKCAELGLAATINQAIAAIVLLPSALACKAFVKTVLLDSYEAMRAKASGGVQPNLNLQIVKSLAVPLPPLVEQTEITSALREQLASMQELAESLAALQRQSTAQRQNLLRAAFAGQLVPQDPADEPADALLARIRAERAERAPAKRRSVRKETA